MAQSHAMPSELKRLGKGEYEVRGTALRIAQGTDGKWRMEGHSDDLGAFGSRGLALGKLQELGLVPEVPAEQPAEAKAEQPAEVVKGVGGKATGERRPTGRKPGARKEPAKASA